MELAEAFKSLLTGSIVVLLHTSVFAQSEIEQFYTGKTIRLIIGYTVGGGYDGYAPRPVVI